jgi:hypothetical protein
MDWFERLRVFAKSPTRRREPSSASKAAVSIPSSTESPMVSANLNCRRFGLFVNAPPPGRLKVSVVTGDVREMHQAPEYAGALVQVASQFNVLEMTGPSVSPEEEVTRYIRDRTQGPACAIAAGAATIYRNYFLPVAGESGQTSTRQIDGLAEVGRSLSAALGRSVETLWQM